MKLQMHFTSDNLLQGTGCYIVRRSVTLIVYLCRRHIIFTWQIQNAPKVQKTFPSMLYYYLGIIVKLVFHIFFNVSSIQSSKYVK